MAQYLQIMSSTIYFVINSCLARAIFNSGSLNFFVFLAYKWQKRRINSIVLNEWDSDQSRSLALGQQHMNLTEDIRKIGSNVVMSKIIDFVQNIGRNYNGHFY